MKPWRDVNEELPNNKEDAYNIEVIGLICPYGDVREGCPDFVHFDGEEWYDRDNRPCTVTHWIPLNFEHIVYLYNKRRR